MSTTINAGASASISLPIGNVVNVTGSGVAVIGAGVRAGSGVTQQIIGRATIGPFDTAATVLLTAVSEMTYSTETPGPSYQPFSASEVSAVKAVVSGDGIVSTSRTAVAADNGATLELADGVTYTLSGSVALPAGVVVMGPASGTATLACTGGATINGGTSSVSITAGQVYSAIPRRTLATAFVVKGS